MSREKHQQPKPIINHSEQQLKDTAKKITEDALQVAKTKVPDYLYHKEDEAEVATNVNSSSNLHQIAVEAIETNKQRQKPPSPLLTPSTAHVSRRDSTHSQTSFQTREVRPAQLEIQQMSSSKLQQDPTAIGSSHSPSFSHTILQNNRNQSEPPPVVSSSQSSLSLNSNTSQPAAPPPPPNYYSHPQLQQPELEQPHLVKQRSQSSFTLPRDAPIPRLCRVRAYEDQLGFTVAGSKANRGVFKVNEVSANSPAAHAGLQNDDYIVEISGVNVEDMSYLEVVNLIKSKKQQDDLQLLVADRATIQFYKNKKIPISSQLVPKMQYIETLLNEELQQQQQQQDQYMENDSSPALYQRHPTPPPNNNNILGGSNNLECKKDL